MEPDFWHERWQRSELGWHLDGVNPLLARYWDRLGVAPGGEVLVPLCGKSRDLLWLAEHGHPVLGIELSQIGVEAFFTEAGLVPSVDQDGPFRRYRSGRVDILCGDFFDLAPRQTADVCAVYDRGALVALKPELRERYINQLQMLFEQPKPTLVISFDYPQHEMGGPPFAVNHTQLDRFFGSSHRIERLAVIDVLPEHPRFQERGLTRMDELAFALHPLMTGAPAEQAVADS